MKPTKAEIEARDDAFTRGEALRLALSKSPGSSWDPVPTVVFDNARKFYTFMKYGADTPPKAHPVPADLYDIDPNPSV